MKSGEAVANDVDVDLGRLFSSLRRKWLGIAFFVLVVTVVAFMLASSATPYYRAETRVLIEERESIFTRPVDTAERAFIDSETIASQVEIITSTEILAEAARTLDLADHEDFRAGEPSLLGRLLILAGVRRASNPQETERRIVNAMRVDLSVYRVDESRVIVIQFSSPDPSLAASVPNAIANAYLASQLAARLESTADATRWLEPEIADLRERVREAEARVASFRAGSGLLMGQNNAMLVNQQLSELSSELSRVRAERSASEAKVETIRGAMERGGSLDTLPDVLASGLIERLRERQVDLRAQIAELSTTLLASHPRIQALQAQLSDLETQIEIEVGKVLEGLEAEADAARQRERDLSADLDRLKVESAEAEESQVELRALEREAAAQRALLESYLTRHREAAARSDRNYLPVDARIFSRAGVPIEPYYPKILPITAAAFAGSLLLACVMILLQELFSGRAFRPAEGSMEPPAPAPVAMPTAAPVPEAVPTGGAEEDGPLDKLSVAAAAEALISKGVSRAVFVSPEGDEAAAAAVLVAREVADAGLRVLLLDLSSSGAASRPMLDSKVYPGISNLLAAEAQFADVIHADLYSSCHVIPVGTAEAARAKRGIDRLAIIMNSLTTAYDLVVVECGPADVATIGRLVDEDAQVLVSVLDPEDGAADAASRLREQGFGRPLLVTPAGQVPPPAPPGRDVA